MKVFVTGSTGQLGYDCINELVRRGHTVIGSGRRSPESKDKIVFPIGTAGQLDLNLSNEPNKQESKAGCSDISPLAVSSSGANDPPRISPAYVQLDITDQNMVYAVLNSVHPDAIIHCAAWTAVDAAEDEENKEKVEAINHQGTRYIAEAAKIIGAKMMYISTDYVFNGQGKRAWKPDDKDFAPLNYYGQTKLNGELAVAETLERFFIVRIAWVFGLNGKNFIKTMINVGKTHDEVRVVNDQIGTPTYTKDLARLLVDMIETDKFGYYHATNEGGYISWYDFCCEFYRQYGMKTRVIPVSTVEYGLSKASRPENSRLDKSKLVAMGFSPLPDWRDAVKRYLEEAQL